MKEVFKDAKKYPKKSLGNDTEQATLKHWVKETAVSRNRRAGGKAGCETDAEPSDTRHMCSRK